jgi:hypothetical protein
MTSSASASSLSETVRAERFGGAQIDDQLSEEAPGRSPSRRAVEAVAGNRPPAALRERFASPRPGKLLTFHGELYGGRRGVSQEQLPVVSPNRSQLDRIDLNAWKLNQAQPPAAAGRHDSMDSDGVDRLQVAVPATAGDLRSAGHQPPAGVVPDDPRSRGPSAGGSVAQGADPIGGGILPPASDPQAPDHKPIEPSQNPGSRSALASGPFGLSEEAMLRLEAGLCAQREEMLLRGLRVAAKTRPRYGGAREEPDECAPPSEPHRFGFPAQVGPQLPLRAAHQRPLPELASAGGEGRDQALEPLQGAATRHRLNWRLPVYVLTAAVIAALAADHFLEAGTFTESGLASVRLALQRELAAFTQTDTQVSSLPVDSSVQSPPVGLGPQSTASPPPAASPQAPEAIESPEQPSTITYQVAPPAGDDTSSPRAPAAAQLRHKIDLRPTDPSHPPPQLSFRSGAAHRLAAAGGESGARPAALRHSRNHRSQ